MIWCEIINLSLAGHTAIRQSFLFSSLMHALMLWVLWMQPSFNPELNFLWCIDATMVPSGKPYSLCRRHSRSHFWRVLVSCGHGQPESSICGKASRLLAWEDLPSVDPYFPPSWSHPFSVTFTLVLSWMWCSSAYQLVTSVHYGWTVKSLCLQATECPLGKSNNLHFKLHRSWIVFMLCLLRIFLILE